MPVFCHRMVVLPSPLLDSGLRRNDEMGGRSPSRIVVRDMLSKQSLMPVAAGTPRCENRDADWRRRVRVICHPYTSPGFPPSRE